MRTNPSPARQSPKKDGTKADIDEVQILLEKLKKTLASRGAGGIIGLGRQFKVKNFFP